MHGQISLLTTIQNNGTPICGLSIEDN